MSLVSADEARRIAVCAQALDGSARGVLDTVRRVGFLQIDPISTVAPPQQLVLWSRLGPHDLAELDGLLWEERRLFEWNAFIWPIEYLPVARAYMRLRRGQYAYERRADAFLRATTMLEILHSRGVLAIVATARGLGPRRALVPGDRDDPVPRGRAASARRPASRARRAPVGDRWEAHPEAVDGEVGDRVTLLSPFDRLIYDRERGEALFGFRCRLEMYVPEAKREYGYYVLPILVGDRLVGRVEPRFDRTTKTLEVLGAWGDTSRLDEALASLAEWLGASRA